MLLLHVDTDNNMPDSFTHITLSIADPAILPLVKRFFHSQGMRAQAAKADEVVIARDLQENRLAIIAALRLCPIGDSWLLRSMSIQATHQRQGIGLFVLDSIKQSLKDKQCYCFPYPHLESFYHQAGFKLIKSEMASLEIQKLYQQYKNNGKEISLMQFSDTVID